MGKIKQLTEEDFDNKYTRVPNHIRPNENSTWETFGEEVKYIWSLDTHNVFTEIDSGDGWYGIIPGKHLVNRINYIVTEQKWTDENEEYTIYDTSGLREEWDNLPIAAVSEITGTTYEITDEDDIQDIKDEFFYMWEEASESYRDEILTKYKDQLKS